MPYQGNYYRPSMFGGFSLFPLVIKWLLITNAAVFVLIQFFGSFSLDGFRLGDVLHFYLGLMPLAHGFLPWQLLTYQFMHADFWHLFFNMFFGLWMFGMEIENLWGPRKFLFYYLMCGVAAGVVQLVLAPVLEPGSMIDLYGRGIPTVGASGAVYGVLIAFAMMFPDRYIYLYFLIPVKAKYLIAGLILLGVLAIGGPGNVANLAHLGGAFAGYVYIMMTRRRVPHSGLFDRLSYWIHSKTSSRATRREDDIVDATVYDIRDGKERRDEKRDGKVATQKQIDEILDKISRGGYQSLTDEEKKILFEASKKLN